MEIIRSVTPQEDAGHALQNVLDQYRTQPILLMLSGGSAFSILEYVEEAVLGPHITLSVLDERYTEDVTVNNFLQLKQTQFFVRCITRGVHSIETEVLQGETAEALSERWERALRIWKKHNPNGVIIATMGIGKDGHTAGIFADMYDVDFYVTAWVVSYHISPEVSVYQDRVTVTYTFLKTCVDEAIVYAEKEEKEALIERVGREDCDNAQYPMCIFHKMKKVRLYTQHTKVLSHIRFV